ncbi:MAG: hypothetical protein AAFX40_12710 [Cyanobacteria bacterium J06639_1]
MKDKRHLTNGRSRWLTAIAVSLIALAIWIWPGGVPVVRAESLAMSARTPTLLSSLQTDIDAIAMAEAPRAEDNTPPEVDGLPAIDSSADFVPGQILVKYRDGGSAEALTEALLSDRARLVQPPSTDNSPALIQLNDLEGLTPEAAKAKTLDAIAELEASDDVIYAEPNFVYSIQ